MNDHFSCFYSLHPFYCLTTFLFSYFLQLSPFYFCFYINFVLVHLIFDQIRDFLFVFFLHLLDTDFITFYLVLFCLYVVLSSASMTLGPVFCSLVTLVQALLFVLRRMHYHYFDYIVVSDCVFCVLF